MDHYTARSQADVAKAMSATSSQRRTFWTEVNKGSKVYRSRTWFRDRDQFRFRRWFQLHYSICSTAYLCLLC